MQKILVLFFLFFTGFSLTSDEIKDWTFMVYMVGNNDLEPDSLNDLNEMTKASSAKANIVTFSDRGMQYTDEGAGGQKPWSGAKKFVVDGSKLKELANLGEIDSTNPKYLKEFVESSIKKYPAKKYALVLWDHGGGWSGYASSEVNPEGGFTPLVLRDTIQSALKTAGVTKLDLMGFDACLMGNFETVSVLQSLTKFYVASEELEPGHGWDYSVLKDSFDKGQDAVSLGKSIISGFLAQSEAEGDRDEVTLSLVDTSKIPQLEKSIANFTSDLGTKLKTISVDLAKSSLKVPRYGKSPEPDEDANLVDLGAFVAKAAGLDTSIKSKADDVSRDLKAAVIQSASGEQTKGSTGLSVYFPAYEKYYDANYDQIGQSSWRTFLKSYFKTNKTSVKEFQDTGMEFGFDGANAKTKKDQDLFEITAPVSDDVAEQIVDATLAYGYKSGKKLYFLGSQPADLDDNNQVYSFWDGYYLELSQGSTRTRVYVDLFYNDDGSTSLMIPFAYFKTGKAAKDYDDVDLIIDLDENFEIVDQKWYSYSDNETFAEFTPKKGSKIAPIFEVYEDGAEDSYFEVSQSLIDPNAKIDYDWKPFKKGDKVVVQLEITNAVDEGDYADTDLSF